MMIKLGVTGAKKSGKTTVIEGLISYLGDKGYRVATMKHTSHRHQFDTPGKDSYRHRQAGAKLTIAVSDNDIAVFTKPDLVDPGQIQDLTEGQFDIWIIEGFRQADHSKIIVTRNLKGFPETMPTNIIATIGPERVENVPVHFEDGDYVGLGDFVISTMIDNEKEARK
jgi:molybdopterin-guanine dinucleotide biosynthesis protein B